MEIAVFLGFLVASVAVISGFTAAFSQFVDLLNNGYVFRWGTLLNIGLIVVALALGFHVYPMLGCLALVPLIVELAATVLELTAIFRLIRNLDLKFFEWAAKVLSYIRIDGRRLLWQDRAHAVRHISLADFEGTKAWGSTMGRLPPSERFISQLIELTAARIAKNEEEVAAIALEIAEYPVLTMPRYWFQLIAVNAYLNLKEPDKALSVLQQIDKRLTHSLQTHYAPTLIQKIEKEKVSEDFAIAIRSCGTKMQTLNPASKLNPEASAKLLPRIGAACLDAGILSSMLTLGFIAIFILFGIQKGQHCVISFGEMLLPFLLLIIPFIYVPTFESSNWQATPGKRLLGLNAVSLSGKALTIEQAYARQVTCIIGYSVPCVLAVVSANPFVLVLLLPLMHLVRTGPYKQNMFDRVTKRAVISIRPASKAKATLAIIGGCMLISAAGACFTLFMSRT